jgi:signal transduction histidine kinase
MQLRTKISQDLHDDVGATLSGIRVFSQLAKERPGHNSEYLDKITHYSDDMLNKLSDIVWSVNAENDGFEQLVSKLHNYAKAMTAAKNIRLDFYFDPMIVKKGRNAGLRKNIYMITREAINNAVKYAECRSLLISLKPCSNGAELIIADDGTGFDPDNTFAGNGLYNMRKRAAEIPGTLDIKTSPGAGTTIRVFFKFT